MEVMNVLVPAYLESKYNNGMMAENCKEESSRPRYLGYIRNPCILSTETNLTKKKMVDPVYAIFFLILLVSILAT